MKKNKSLLIIVSVWLLSFVLLYIALKFINNSEITVKNIAAYTVFSAVLGVLAGIFNHYNLKYALIIFIAGILLGYFQLFRSLLAGIDGWGDLAGILSLFVFVTGGIAAGLAIQLTVYVYNKNKGE